MYDITLMELVPNAFIEAMKLDPMRRRLSFQAIEEYGCRVLAALQAAGERAYLFLDLYNTMNFLHDNADYFTMSADSAWLEVASSKTKSDLIERFRGYLPLDLLKVFCNPMVVKGMPDTYAENRTR